jgi:hypothetical protein
MASASARGSAKSGYGVDRVGVGQPEAGEDVAEHLDE